MASTCRRMQAWPLLLSNRYKGFSVENDLCVDVGDVVDGTDVVVLSSELSGNGFKKKKKRTNHVINKRAMHQ